MFRQAPRGLWFVVAVAVLATPALAKGRKGKGGGSSHPAPAPASASSRRAPVDVKLTGGEPAPDTSAAAPSQGGGGPPSRGPTRIDFDDRLIQGQTNKSGAVYLYDRKELKQRSMVKVRESFRQEIVGSIYDR